MPRPGRRRPTQDGRSLVWQRWLICGLGRLSLMTALAVAGACQQPTGKLTAAQQERLRAEGVIRRADDLMFRYTRHAGRRDASWEDRRASIIVTRQSVIIHKNEKLGLQITGR